MIESIALQHYRLDISSQSNKNDEVKNEVENNDDNHLHPDKTIIHVTTLDELVQVSNNLMKFLIQFL